MNPRVRPAPPALPFPPEPTSSPAVRGADESDGPDESHWDFCPNCSERLINDRCKYRCPRCHYFMSGSDFD